MISGVKWVYIYLVSVLFIISAVLISFVLIDPYYQNGYVNLEGLNARKLKSHPMTSKVFYEKLKTKKYILIFGTSRSAKISNEMMGTEVLNFSSSIYGNPYDVLNFLTQLEDDQIKNIQSIYYLIDNHTFNERKMDPVDYKSAKIFDLLLQLRTFDFAKFIDVYTTCDRNFHNNFMREIDPNGFVRNYNEETMPEKRSSINALKKIRAPKYNDITIKQLNEISNYCKKKKIKIVFFTSTMNVAFMNKIDREKFIKMRKEQLHEIPSLLELAYIDKVSDTATNFTNFTHLDTNATTWTVRNIILKEPSKYAVTFSTADRFYNEIFQNIDNNKSDVFMHQLNFKYIMKE